MNGINNDLLFLQCVKRKCIEYGVTFLAVDNDHVVMKHHQSDTKVSGYFGIQEDGKPILCVATKRPFDVWFPILVHEFCHMLQWIERYPPFMRLHEHTRIWQWLNHDLEMNSQEIACDINAQLQIELDAEKRAVDVIYTYQLSLDLKDYIKQANAHLFCYRYAQLFRTWPSVNPPPYRDARILDLMPDYFLDNYDCIHHSYLELYKMIYQPIPTGIVSVIPQKSKMRANL